MFIDLERDGPEQALGDGEVDLVFDLLGGEVLAWSWSVVKPGGALVSVAEPPEATAPAARLRDTRVVFFVVEPTVRSWPSWRGGSTWARSVWW